MATGIAKYKPAPSFLGSVAGKIGLGALTGGLSGIGAGVGAGIGFLGAKNPALGEVASLYASSKGKADEPNKMEPVTTETLPAVEDSAISRRLSGAEKDPVTVLNDGLEALKEHPDLQAHYLEPFMQAKHFGPWSA